MSYCRWSSDNFKSDLYVYEHVAGFFSINVASRRLVETPPEVPPLTEAKFMPDEESTQWWADWLTAHNAQMAWLETAEYQKIDLPHAGESFAEATAADAVARLKMLQELGYHVPQYAIESLEEEAADAGSD
jgi:hypothetical protein